MSDLERRVGKLEAACASKEKPSTIMFRDTQEDYKEWQVRWMNSADEAAAQVTSNIRRLLFPFWCLLGAYRTTFARQLQQLKAN